MFDVRSLIVRIRNSPSRHVAPFTELTGIDASIKFIGIQRFLASEDESKLRLHRTSIGGCGKLPIVPGREKYAVLTVTAPTGSKILDRPPFTFSIFRLLHDAELRIRCRKRCLPFGAINKKEAKALVIAVKRHPFS